MSLFSRVHWLLLYHLFILCLLQLLWCSLEVFDKFMLWEQRFEENLICFSLGILVSIRLNISLLICVNCFLFFKRHRRTSYIIRCYLSLADFSLNIHAWNMEQLLGDGKSQFLKFAAKLSNRLVITTGLGTTSAGLAVTAVKDGGKIEWLNEKGFTLNTVHIFVRLSILSSLRSLSYSFFSMDWI